jgi:hypothetical protein
MAKRSFEISSACFYSLKSDEIPMQRKKPRIVLKPAESRPRLSLEDIRQIFIGHLPELRKEYSIRNIWLFGSYV